MALKPLVILPLSLFWALNNSQADSTTLTADTTRFNYAETGSAGLLDTETNRFTDINGLSLWHESSLKGIYWGLSYAQGQTDYVGGTMSNPIYGSLRSTTMNRIIDSALGYKKVSILDRRGDIEMHTRLGLGYRGWWRALESTPTVNGYDEFYHWGYLNAGIGFNVLLTSRLSLGIDADVRKALYSRMYENLHNYNFKLRNVYGYKISVPLAYRINQKWDAVFQYNYEFWNISASDKIGNFYEPDSTTKNVTLSVGVKYNF